MVYNLPCFIYAVVHSQFLAAFFFIKKTLGQYSLLNLHIKLNGKKFMNETACF